MSFFTQSSLFSQPIRTGPLTLREIHEETMRTQISQVDDVLKKHGFVKTQETPDLSGRDGTWESHVLNSRKAQSNINEESQSKLESQHSLISSPSYSPKTQSQGQNDTNRLTSTSPLREDSQMFFDDNETSLRDDLQNETQTTNQWSQQLFNSQQQLIDTYCDERPAQAPNSQALIMTSDTGVPESIMQLLRDVKEKYSDCTFVSLLARQCCKNFFPSNSYMNLKFSLLLSLASINFNSVPIPIVAIGQEFHHANTIMNSIGKFSKRFISSSIPKFDGFLEGKKAVAGPLSMATGGVLRIGLWDFLPLPSILDVLRSIETGKINDSNDLNCAIWTYWSASEAKKDFKSINQFLNVFGVPIVLEDTQNEDDIIDFILNVEDHGDALISVNDMKAYVSFVSKFQTCFEPEADALLNNYYSSTRKLRENALSPRAFDVLRQMAESHAKLCFRTNVVTCDVVAAINISEKFIRTLFDRDTFSSPAEPVLNSIEDIDKYQGQLYDWCCEFTQRILQI